MRGAAGVGLVVIDLLIVNVGRAVAELTIAEASSGEIVRVTGGARTVWDGARITVNVTLFPASAGVFDSMDVDIWVVVSAGREFTLSVHGLCEVGVAKGVKSETRVIGVTDVVINSSEPCCVDP